jgi:c-di-GMP-binding flagellar brake protein YcgR
MDDYSYYENLRDAPRISSSVFVKYEIRNEYNTPAAKGVTTTRDISAGGMKFFCATAVRKDYIVKLQIELDKLNIIPAVGVVAWVEQPKAGQYLVGIRFTSITEDAKTKIVRHLNKYAPKN